VKDEDIVNLPKIVLLMLEIKQPPYEAMFGKKVCLGLKMSFLPNDKIIM